MACCFNLINLVYWQIVTANKRWLAATLAKMSSTHLHTYTEHGYILSYCCESLRQLWIFNAENWAAIDRIRCSIEIFRFAYLRSAHVVLHFVFYVCHVFIYAYICHRYEYEFVYAPLIWMNMCYHVHASVATQASSTIRIIIHNLIEFHICQHQFGVH